MEIRKSALGDRKITVDEAKDNSDKKMIENIQTIDMYELGEKSLCLGTRHIEDIWEDMTALEVADNNPDCYRDILVRILETTLLEPIDIEKEIHYVARRYNQRSVIKEDSRLVFDDWK